MCLRYRLTAFRPKCCRGVSLVREISPCSRTKTAKTVCRPGFLPSITDRMFGVVELWLLLADFGNSSLEKWHFSPYSRTAVAVPTEFRVHLEYHVRKRCWCLLTSERAACIFAAGDDGSSTNLSAQEYATKGLHKGFVCFEIHIVAPQSTLI